MSTHSILSHQNIVFCCMLCNWNTESVGKRLPVGLTEINISETRSAAKRSSLLAGSKSRRNYIYTKMGVRECIEKEFYPSRMKYPDFQTKASLSEPPGEQS